MISISFKSLFRISSVKKIGLFVLIYFSFLGFALGQSPEDIVPDYNHLTGIDLGTAGTSSTENIIISVAVDSQGFIYTLSFGNGVDKRNPDGSMNQEKLIPGNLLQDPLDIEIDSSGNIYIADYFEGGSCLDNGKVKIFNSNGGFENEIAYSYFRPLGLAIDINDNIYVAEYYDGSTCESEEDSRIRVFDINGVLLDETKSVEIPFRLDVDSQSTLYVSQAGDDNPQVLYFDSNLNFQGTLSNIISPGSVVVDEFDFIHVVEYAGRVDFEKFLNYDQLEISELFPLALNIQQGINSNDFGFKIFNPTRGFEYYYQDSNIKFPVDIAINDLVCDSKLYLNNANIDGFSLQFDLEIYDRTPTFDNINPVANCGGDFDLQLVNGSASISVEDVNNGSTDNCGIKDIGLSQTAFTDAGIFDVVMTVTDNAGNQDSCLVKVTVLAEEEPTFDINCIGTKNVNILDDQPVTILAKDLVTGDTSGLSFNPSSYQFDCSDIGTKTITITAKDDNTGVEDSCNVNILVKDTGKPVILCSKPDVKVSLQQGDTYTVPNFRNEIDFNDNCDTNLSYSQTPVPNTEIDQNATVTITITDDAGNEETCSFEIIVVVEEPTLEINCTGSRTVTLSDDQPVTILASDLITGDTSNLSFSPENFEFDCSDIGTQNVSVTATDNDSGATDSCTVSIKVEDIAKPIFTSCPSATIVINVPIGETGAVYEAPLIEATDNCGEVNVIQTKGPEGGATLPLGFTDFEFTATDDNGLTATCVFQVEVREEGEVLDITCPGSVPVPADENCVYIVPDLSDVVSTNIDGAVIDQDIEAGNVFQPNSDLYVTVTATFEDQSDSCRIYLSPVDEEDPVARCVGDTEIRLAEGETIQLNAEDFDAGSSDNCQIATYNLDRNSLSSADEGENVITLTVNDAAGNLDSCEFTVNVIVEEPGEIDFSCLIVEYKLTPDENCEYFLPDFSEILEYSPADADFEQSITSGTQLFEDIEVEVTVSYQGESKACNLYVSLEEDQPQAVCRSDFQIQLNEGETVTIQPEDLDNGSFANCSETSLSLDKTEFTSADLGANIVTLTVTDEAGNTDTCQTTVNVVLNGSGGNQPPVAIDDEYTTNINTTLEVSTSNGVLVNDTDPENDELTVILQDDVSNGTLDLNADGSFTYTPDQNFFGQDYFTYIANDGELNSNIIFVSINVENGNGEFSCVERLTLSLNSEGSAELNIEDLYSGNAEGIEFGATERFFSCEDIGENTVTLVYTGRQEGSCEIVVEVIDMSAPVLALNDLEVSLNEAGVATITFNDLDAGSRDNCNGEVIYTLSESAFTCKNLGENEILVTAEDSSGNSSTRTAMVTVLDNEGFCNNFGEGSEYIFIYPNPNTGSFKIATPADVFIERIEVFDHRGRFIAARDYESTATEYPMEVGPLQESVYVVKIVTNERTLTKRFIFKY